MRRGTARRPRHARSGTRRGRCRWRRATLAAEDHFRAHAAHGGSACPRYAKRGPDRQNAGARYDPAADMSGDPTQTLLLYFIMPVWFLAGFADYLCHRATDIAHTAGP